jgi:hypothetical protein
MACANVLVTIDVTPERLLRIVQVKHLETIQSDQPFELPKGVFVAVS